MRIAFSGPSGTGKTALAEWVSKQYSLPFCPVGSRSVARQMGFENPYDVDAAGMRAIFQRNLFESKCAWESDHPSLVTDRTVLDNLAYNVLHGSSEKMWMAEVDEYFAAMKYDLVFFCPVHAFQKLGDDAARLKHDGYHFAYEVLLRGLLDRWHPHGHRKGHPVDGLLVLNDSTLSARQQAVGSVLYRRWGVTPLDSRDPPPSPGGRLALVPNRLKPEG